MIISFKLRLKIYMRDGFVCRYCNKAMNPLSDDLSLDHVHPDGNSTEENLVTSCQACNSSKGAKSVEEFRVFLAVQADRATREPNGALREIADAILLGSGYSVQDLVSVRQVKELVTLRTLVAVRGRAAGFSLPAIGKFLNRHHTTVMHMLSLYAQRIHNQQEAGANLTS